MSDRRSRRPLRSQGLRVALACLLAASLSGCASFRMHGFGYGASETSCRSDAWPTQVMGSVQRTAAEADVPESVTEYGFEPESRTERVAKVSPPPAIEERAEPFPESRPVPEAEELPEPMVEESTEPVPKSSIEPSAENSSVSEPTPQAAPGPPPSPPPSVEPPLPPAVAPPPAEPQQDIARLPEPVVPPPPPSPEVVEVCGTTDKTCQDQLMALLADPTRKWINQKPTPRDERTGVRILAYRVLAPELACEDLRQGLQETRVTAPESPMPEPEAGENGKSLEWVQLLRRAVELELNAEIEKRCQ